MGKQANVTDKREGPEAAPDTIQRIIADLENVDKRFAELLAAPGAPAGDAGEKARALLRSAIETLKPAAQPEAGEEAGPIKRRVKIKAESEIAAPGDGERAGTAAKSGTSGKSSSRGGRSTSARRAANANKTPSGLLARLGAATEAPPPAQAQAEPPADPAPTPKAGDTLKATADRLAQLEAEIADLTEAVTAVPTSQRNAASAARPDTPAAEPSRADDEDDGGDAEITIVGADGAPAVPASRATREAPRIFRDGPMPDEEEAEVEIKGDGAAALRRRGTDRVSLTADKRGSLAKWRIFRGSN